MKHLPVVLDCDMGRRLGCESFCCRLIVRLGPGEAPPDDRSTSCVAKDPSDGLCVHFDRETGRCDIWDRRPAVCKGYDCNRDPLLQVVLRRGYRSLLQLLRDYRELTPRAKDTVPLLDR